MLAVQSAKEQDNKELTETIQNKMEKAEFNKNESEKQRQLDMMRR